MIAVAAARRDQLLRLLDRRLRRRSPRLLERVQRLLWCRYSVLAPLERELGAATVCLFSHYDRQGLVEPYVLHHLQRLAEAGVLTIFVTTARLDRRAAAALAPTCAAIIERDNLGFDFGSWRTALLAYPQLLACETLLFVNDSVYGPMSDLRPLLDRMAASGCDFWGVTESRQIAPHYQSYFLAFHRRCLRSRAFRDLFLEIDLLADKQQVIDRYEVTLYRRLAGAGLRGAACVPSPPEADANENPTLHRWREILAAGAPYLKVQLLRENPHHLPIGDWREVVRGRGYDPALIERHLRRSAAGSVD
jgi:lipopolysaccharide biosynthesis protein